MPEAATLELRPPAKVREALGVARPTANRLRDTISSIRPGADINMRTAGARHEIDLDPDLAAGNETDQDEDGVIESDADQIGDLQGSQQDDEGESLEHGGDGARAHKPQFSWGARIACGIIAAAMILFASAMPIWITKLLAPQYPGGLELTVYGSKVAGDVFEVDTLNHYVGMKPFRFDEVPEAKLWLPAIVVAVLATIVATVVGRRWLGRLARLYVWLLPVGVLADIQYRLYDFGHHLNPDAPLRMKGFTPLVVGPTKVWNFTAWSLPGTGLMVIFAAGVLLSFGPKLIDAVAKGISARSGNSERASSEAQ